MHIYTVIRSCQRTKATSVECRFHTYRNGAFFHWLTTCGNKKFNWFLIKDKSNNQIFEAYTVASVCPHPYLAFTIGALLFVGKMQSLCTLFISIINFSGDFIYIASCFYFRPPNVSLKPPNNVLISIFRWVHQFSPKLN